MRKIFSKNSLSSFTMRRSLYFSMVSRSLFSSLSSRTMEMPYKFSTIKTPQNNLVDCHKLQTYIQCPKTLSNLAKNGINALFPIQANSYNDIYKGEDVIASDRTGSGKTMAFTLPIIQRMRKNNVFSNKTQRGVKFLVMAPTRQLAQQISSQINKFKHFPNQINIATLIGGADMMAQRNELRRGAHIIVATPGRLMDFYNRGDINFKQIQAVCIDEADLMMEKGFKDDIQFILERVHQQTNEKPQHLLFSATMPKWVAQLTQKYMSPTKKQLNLIDNNETLTSKTVQHICIEVQPQHKLTAIKALIKQYSNNGSVLIFTNKKIEANFLGEDLPIKNCVLHGDISQAVRTKRMMDFKSGKIKVLIATDVASRGLDIKNVELVIQDSPPQKLDSYIHRSGRTGRAGKTGISITLINKFSQDQKLLMSKIMSQIKIDLNVMRLSLDQENKNKVNLEQEAAQQFFKEVKKLRDRSNKTSFRNHSSRNNSQNNNRQEDPYNLIVHLDNLYTQINYNSLREQIFNLVGVKPSRFGKTTNKNNKTTLFIQFENSLHCSQLANKMLNVTGEKDGEVICESQRARKKFLKEK